MRGAVHVAHMSENTNACTDLVRKLQGNKPRRRWEDNINMELEET